MPQESRLYDQHLISVFLWCGSIRLWLSEPACIVGIYDKVNVRSRDRSRDYISVDTFSFIRGVLVASVLTATHPGFYLALKSQIHRDSVCFIGFSTSCKQLKS